MILSQWWVWMLAAFALAFLELISPAWVFLGFAIGAAGVSALLAFGPTAGLFAGSVSLTFLAFALLSLAGWILLRRVFGARGEIKIWHKDIND